jgi:hypothetical protein
MGYVRLILLPPTESSPSLLLQIPITTILLLSYLRFLGWSVLGIAGVVKLGETEVEQDGRLQDGETYHYNVPGGGGPSFCTVIVQNLIADT